LFCSFPPPPHAASVAQPTVVMSRVESFMACPLNRIGVESARA
jgi:hypothetical protein